MNRAIVSFLVGMSMVMATGTVAAKDYTTTQFIGHEHLKGTALLLPAGKTHMEVAGGGSFSCVVVAPDLTTLAMHGTVMPKGRVLGGQLAVHKCSFDVKLSEATVVIFLVENDNTDESDQEDPYFISLVH